MRENGMHPGGNRFIALVCSEIEGKRLSMKKLRIMSVFGTRRRQLRCAPW